MGTVLEPSLHKGTRAQASAWADRRFYFRMAVASFVVAVVGFAPTFWAPMAAGRVALAPILYLHAALFYGWTLLFMWQTWLVAAGRTARHRELGIAGAALASGMVFVGLGAAIHSMKLADATGLGPAGRSFSILPVTNIALFAALVGVAISYVREPKVHKRLMLVAMSVFLTPAIARWVIFLLAPSNIAPQGGLAGPGPVSLSILPALLSNCFIVVGMIHDKKALGRVHSTYWLAGGCVLAMELLRVPFSETDAWMRVTDWLVALAP